MRLKVAGYAKAYIPPTTPGGKGQYVDVGRLLADEKEERLALKLDALPLPGSGWEGWINIFPSATRGSSNDEAPF